MKVTRTLTCIGLLQCVSGRYECSLRRSSRSRLSSESDNAGKTDLIVRVRRGDKLGTRDLLAVTCGRKVAVWGKFLLKFHEIFELAARREPCFFKVLRSTSLIFLLKPGEKISMLKPCAVLLSRPSPVNLEPPPSRTPRPTYTWTDTTLPSAQRSRSSASLSSNGQLYIRLVSPTPKPLLRRSLSSFN